MRWIIFTLRITATPLIVISFIILLLFLNLLPVSGDKRLFLKTKITSLYSRGAFKVYGIRGELVGCERLERDSSYLIVSNHLSYIDIVIIASFIPRAVFITSFDIRNFLLPGILARVCASIFVNRRSASGIKGEIKTISDTLERGFNVILFPEATSTNGERILPFKSSFMNAAIQARKPVLPLCIKYRKIENEPINTHTRDFVYWYGGMGFFSHLIKLLSVKSVDVALIILERIDAGQNSSRKAISKEAYKRITSVYEKEYRGMAG